MQKITLICMGKMTKPYAELVHEYEKRLANLCQFSVVELAEVALREKNLSEKQIRQALEKEGEHILATLPKQVRVAALCVEGKELDSHMFSHWLAQREPFAHVALLIGSSHGLSQQVKDRADMKISLSRMTLPHQLARLVLTEQVYRAQMIQAGSAYHK